mmetsp:Transcript_32407/g.82317  ORF Transcript_32407/g.82317 Transcript_32407/m.82317 type:complete len:373 (-) Transcript_32407:248-1366(-)|eukprot:CAMPEP_0202861058 /NCGR_PEP_ID=MMETSP1391-20130828/2587_1 /ASSEMBLY_ACC=CAM_ASM_000867 /TAXON_ID=1034604 /ORGANISM="Chlamydomonas leiostraca, Strain SAG 11-49" /LENGTH=372 /DNA_ID=CAMNT_0049540379 /DNA_START=38 /DNA_END=1156 /DNA_ORIENTATION=-
MTEGLLGPLQLYPSALREGGVQRGFPKPSLNYLLGRPGPTGYGSASTAEQVAEGWGGSGRVILITGASCGLGAEAARVLAARGAHIVMLGRDAAAMQAVVQQVQAKTPGAKMDVIPCDLNDLAGVASAAKAFLAMKLPLHCLMLNAGVMACPLAVTAQGIERQLGVNHVAHYLLTRLLLGTLAETASQPGAPQGRVIVLSSAAHTMARDRGQDLALLRDDAPALADKATYSPWPAYGRSKLANILFARELQHRLAGFGGIAVAAVHPGGIPSTRLSRHLNVPQFIQAALLPLLRPVFKTTQQGAATQVYLAVAPGSIPGGEYWSDCNLCGSTPASHDAVLGRALWAGSEKVVAEFVDSSARSSKDPVDWAAS